MFGENNSLVCPLILTSFSVVAFRQMSKSKFEKKYNMVGDIAESVFMARSMTFALEVIRLRRVPREAKCEGALINQFLCSGTSIGGNVCEVFYAQQYKSSGGLS